MCPQMLVSRWAFKTDLVGCGDSSNISGGRMTTGHVGAAGSGTGKHLQTCPLWLFFPFWHTKHELHVSPRNCSPSASRHGQDPGKWCFHCGILVPKTLNSLVSSSFPGSLPCSSF